MNISVDKLKSEDRGSGSSVFHINAIAPITVKSFNLTLPLNLLQDPTKHSRENDVHFIC